MVWIPFHQAPIQCKKQVVPSNQLGLVVVKSRFRVIAMFESFQLPPLIETLRAKHRMVFKYIYLYTRAKKTCSKPFFVKNYWHRCFSVCWIKLNAVFFFNIVDNLTMCH